MAYKKLFIHASNVHAGGGGVLFADLLTSIGCDINVCVLVSHKIKIPFALPPNVNIKILDSTLYQRIKVEFWLLKNVQEDDCVICFGNLPPLFKLRGKVVVFLQNRFFVDSSFVNELNIQQKLNIFVRKAFFLKMASNVQQYIVQTQSMARLLRATIGNLKPIHLFPFMAGQISQLHFLNTQLTEGIYNFNFIYVASGELHKNHRRLLDTWVTLASDGIYPTLHITIIEAEWPELLGEVNFVKNTYGLNIINHGRLTHKHILELYLNCDALVYPSLFESFGLPLVEASRLGMPIIASELDYVRDLVNPDQTFNPHSSISIARAIKRFMGVDVKFPDIKGSKDFLHFIMGEI